MATPTLFYGVPSGCSFGSIVALEWLGQPYRLSRIEMPEVVTSDAYRKINPVGETPTLMDAQGNFLSESMAILNHIGARGIERKLGFAQGTRDFDRLNQQLAYLNTSYFGAFAPLWHALEGVDETDRPALARYGTEQVRQVHQELEAMLGERPWLLGEHRTVADAYFSGIARWSKYHKVLNVEDFPNLQRLCNQLEADPAVRFAHAIERQASAQSEGGFQGHVTLEEVLAQR
ncbi:glutathione S-transferase family protein [Cupriavidus sp. WGlv3]|uniref:glutathione S-transferase family protein n=1 Tax=Cupriavidus sp. WGlv3 TaxID=2919924 RepID=UPI002090A4BC|nr:glutathione S-transferase family protein [Cupriavidus sp. WGlv3]MCO4861528.1 glutathione S-transferase family protein [Cupriavidus sp. WGlv3]